MQNWKKILAILLFVGIILTVIYAVWDGITNPENDHSSQNSSNVEGPSENPEPTNRVEGTNTPEGNRGENEGITLSKEEYEQFKQMAEMLLGEKEQQPSQEPSETEPAPEPTNEPEEVEPPKAVVIQNSDGMRRHDPRVCENAYEAMAGDAVWLGQEGSFSLMLFGDVKEVYAANNSSNYTEYKQVTISGVTNATQSYYALDYSCIQNQRILFRVVMTNGAEYFLSVQKT